MSNRIQSVDDIAGILEFRTDRLFIEQNSASVDLRDVVVERGAGRDWIR